MTTTIIIIGLCFLPALCKIAFCGWTLLVVLWETITGKDQVEADKFSEMIRRNREQYDADRAEREQRRIRRGEKMIQHRQCDNCGAPLSIVDGHFTCQYCGTYYGTVKQIVRRAYAG